MNIIEVNGQFGSYATQKIAPFPLDGIAAVEFTVPQDTPAGKQGGLFFADDRTGPRKRTASLAAAPGVLNAPWPYSMSGSTISFNYIIGAAPRFIGQCRLEPGGTYYVNIQTVRSDVTDNPMVYTMRAPE